MFPGILCHYLFEKALRLGAADLSEKRIRKRLQDLTSEKFPKMKDLINLVASRVDLNAKDGKKYVLGAPKHEKLRLGGAWGCLRSVLGCLDSVLGHLRLASGMSWAAPVALLDRLRRVLGASWAALAGVLGLSWTALAAKTDKGRKKNVFSSPLGLVLASIFDGFWMSFRIILRTKGIPAR